MGKFCMLLALGLMISACAETVEPTPTQYSIYRLATSSSLQPAVVSWMNAYANDALYQGDLFLEVLPSTSLLSSVESGQVELAIIAQQPPLDWFATPLGRKAIAVILHPQNSRSSFTLEELSGLFSGRIQTWDSFDLSLGEVKPVIPMPGDAVREHFMSLVMNGQSFSPFASLVATPEMMLERVSQYPGGIGFLFFDQTIEGTNIVRLEGRYPSSSMDKPEEYPLWVDIVATAPKAPGGSLYTFLLWLQSTYLPAEVDQGSP